MTTWLTFLTEQGAKISADAAPRVLSFGAEIPSDTAKTNFVTPLTHLGLIAAVGEDAPHFLHNQLTNDVEHLNSTEARLAGYCSPKGRLLASMLIWKTADGIMLQLPRELQAAIQKRLQMFVLRAKAKLSDATEDHVMLGLAGPAVASSLMPFFPTLPVAIYGKIESAAGTLIRHSNAFGVPRYQWITTAAQAIEAWPKLTEVLQASGADAWQLAEIDSGVPHITLTTQEKFVPQMINFELIGGVNFKKGCYPGQEIVARSQYLGKLKRRMLHASVAATEVVPGTEIFSANDPEQPCGMVVNAERSNAQTIDCLVEIKLAATESEVHLGSAQGPVLSFLTLPYPLTDPAV
ncbi:CAF17-like 4Fe-4S cluster assembly/insertion protein YgfZ [Herminiimonas arsenitoxidans]|uniref:CAF17-like 4Fe-4S cluster assembly/insertion protein YgfZ n=1 Tax=Herminiimonas arsenitoxidans TaxID=1809410 RepID=UPI0009705CB4|nr:folate-binding protein YgfZ [Herminiimonas arsenitoxidans]